MDQGGTLYTGVRAAVDIAAPGERLLLAAYLGDSGTIGASTALAGWVQTPSPTDRYFTNMDGTSYSAPLVAGGIALLKDVAKTDPFLNLNATPVAFDTRVIKSVLMAGADKTEGWNNGQNAFNVTTQALDLTTGAGAMNLSTAATVYLFGTRDLAESVGGAIDAVGWDSATIPLGSTLEYVFASPFTTEMTLNVALN
jgi:subtilisin family serine protease